MIVSPSKKNKIALTDYHYRRDIENRLLMSEFSVFDVTVLEEILNGPLKISLDEMADDLEADLALVRLSVEKISRTGLLTLQSDDIVVNKEMRKYYDFQILKFEDDFEPGMEFLQSLLSKVPIQVLPSWYAIPKSADNIFESIVEHLLLTPRVYERYITELAIEDRIMNSMIEDVFSAPGFKVFGDDLRKKYSLTRELFEEYLLHLEFNFLCCLSYNQVDGEWKEIVTPFAEWREYLRFQRDTRPKPIENIQSIELDHIESFGYCRDLARVLELAQHGQLELTDNNTLTSKSLGTLTSATKAAPRDSAGNPVGLADYFYDIVKRLQALELIIDGQVTLEGETWLGLSLREQAIYLYRKAVPKVELQKKFPDLCIDRNSRELERALSEVKTLGWIQFNDFIAQLTHPIGSAEDVVLKKVGRKWRYALPDYSEQDVSLIRALISERFFQVGLVETGYVDGELCFRVTELGQETLSI